MRGNDARTTNRRYEGQKTCCERFVFDNPCRRFSADTIRFSRNISMLHVSKIKSKDAEFFPNRFPRTNKLKTFCALQHRWSEHFTTRFIAVFALFRKVRFLIVRYFIVHVCTSETLNHACVIIISSARASILYFLYKSSRLRDLNKYVTKYALLEILIIIFLLCI